MDNDDTVMAIVGLTADCLEEMSARLGELQALQLRIVTALRKLVDIENEDRPEPDNAG